ncbi:MAG: PUA domain-containing protein [Halobacteriota archaeon]
MGGADSGPLTQAERETVGAIATYQFGPDVATYLLETLQFTEISRSRSGRIDRLYTADGRVATLTTHGRFTLGLAGARALHAATDPPAYRVVLDDEAVPFVVDGSNAFAKFVIRVDPRIRPRDEVLLVDGTDTLLAVGRASLSASAMTAFDRGMAVSVRHARGESSE